MAIDDQLCLDQTANYPSLLYEIIKCWWCRTAHQY